MIKFLANFYKNQKFLFWLALSTLVLITVTAIIFQMDVIRLIPLYVSLAIMVLQANVNRYAFLLGAVNSLLYALVYALNSQYSSLVYAVLVSCPLQVVTFINWNKKTTNNQTELRSMGALKLIFSLVICAVAWVIFYYAWDATLNFIVNAIGLKSTISDSAGAIKILDNTATVLGIYCTILIMLRFKDYPVFQLISQGVAIALYAIMMGQQLGQITYVIFSVYSGICIIRAWINIARREKEKIKDQGI